MSSSQLIKNVVLAGASGNLGPFLLDALVEAGLSVTVLTRPSSSATFPSSIKVANVDFNDVLTLKSALAGIDAVIALLPHGEAQDNLIRASKKAGVKVVVPGEFGNVRPPLFARLCAS
jgi:uncharacterized protein YbjT (DUF2867 family)